MGIFSKNREEWAMINIANVKTSTTTVAFYDTLGPSAVEFVINQTHLSTISCSGNYVSGLLKLKTEG
jgi:long-chain acyl-CoA synthetase